MADREIRIPITVELQASGKGKKAPTTKANAKTQPTKKPDKQTSSSGGIGQAISAGLLIESSKKLLSATGNAEASAVIEKATKYGTLAARSLSGDITAMVTMAVELAATGLQKIQELKDKAQQDNQTMYNKIKTGQVYLGTNNITVSQDMWGNKAYNKR
jgi:hypothetical protein